MGCNCGGHSGAVTCFVNLKIHKYRSLAERFHFHPLGFETFGTWGQAAKEIIGQIGKKIGDTTGESRSLSFLRQRISIEIQRGNAISALGAFKWSKRLDEVFYVFRSK